MDKADEKLSLLQALWRDKCGTRAMPSRSDFQVVILKPWLGHLALIEVSNDSDAVFRLCGTNLHPRFDGECSKRKISTLDIEIGAPFLICIQEVCQSRSPLEHAGERLNGSMRVSFRDLFLPLSEGGSSVSMLLFASYATNGVAPNH
jgi:hypothetical protein